MVNSNHNQEKSEDPNEGNQTDHQNEKELKGEYNEDKEGALPISIFNISFFFFPRQTNLKIIVMIAYFVTLLQGMADRCNFIDCWCDNSNWRYCLSKHIEVFIVYSLAMYAYWAVHIYLNQYVLSTVQSDNIDQFMNNDNFHLELTKKQQRQTEQYEREKLFVLEIVRGVFALIWIPCVQLYLGHNSAVFLWSIFYSVLGTLSVEATNDNHFITILMLLFVNTSHIISMYVAGSSLNLCIGIYAITIMIDFVFVGLIDFMKKISSAYIHQKEIEVKRENDILYRKLYFSAPDIFLSVSSDESFKILNCNRAALMAFDKNFKEVLENPEKSSLYYKSLFELFEPKSKQIVMQKLKNFVKISRGKNLSEMPHNFERLSPIYVKTQEGKKMICSVSINPITLGEVPLNPGYKLSSYTLQEMDQIQNHDQSRPQHKTQNKNEKLEQQNNKRSKVEDQNTTTANNEKSPHELLCFNIIIHDLTEKYELMDQLRQEKEKAEKANSAKSLFLAQVSHELRTPLHGIINLTELLLQSSGLNREQHDFASSVKYSGQILLSIIQDILDFSKIESSRVELDKQDFDIYHSLSQVNKATFLPQAEKKKIQFFLEIDKKNVPQYLYGDENRLMQIIMNLVNNSLKFTKEGYVKLYITTDHSQESKSSEDDIELKICVEDTGCGISKQEMDRLFEKFSRVSKNHNNEGAGLGLYISKNLISLMNGSIKVNSELGKGSKFSFNVFLKKSKQNPFIRQDSNSNNTTEKISQSKLKVLISEDNEINQKVLAKLLTKLKIDQIQIASDGQQAVEIYEKERPFDIIFMDIFMPKVDGFEALQRIRQIEQNDLCFQKSKIVALTANALTETKEKCIHGGFDAFLSKPATMDDISEVVHTVLNS